jgi:hypothetical protein
MGMSTHVVGFKPPDEKWQKMFAALQACAAAGVDVPDEVERFFEYDEPDPTGVRVPEKTLIAAGAVAEWSDQYRQGFEINVAKLPKDVTVVRVYNSW